MRTTTLAIAAMAITPAYAQSSVTLSGVLDNGFQKTASGQPFELATNRNGTSQWTLTGTEDLGGGLKAQFKISTSINADVGTVAGTNGLGNNDMWVGLEGGFGAIKLGRSFNPVFSHHLTANSTKGVLGYQTLGIALDTMGVYVPNQMLYTTPTLSGWTGTVSYAPSEVAGAKSHTALAVRYSDGPLVLTAASGNEHTAPVAAPGITTSGAFKTKNLTQLGAAYDFGMARVLFTWQDDGNLANDRDTGYAVGITAPLGGGTIWGSYDVKELAGTDGRVFQLGYKYPLSKRTLVYLQFGRKNAAMAAAATGTSGYGFGVQHTF